ncbi:MAG TPA: peptidyl-prolyl cis-trans isomerase [Nitrospirota bacterium]|nr:peptidyl-prolyl cis-trans isomerase [Nitrospirota bacterium]
MRNILLAIVGATTVLFFSAIKGTASGSVVVDRVVAIVNEDIITLSDLQREEALRKSDTKLDEKVLLEDMIDRKLQMAAAKRAGMDVTDKELSDAVEDIMKRNSMNTKQFEAAIGKEGLTLEQYRTELREQMTMSRMFNKYVRSGITVNDQEARDYYDHNHALYSLPEEIRLRQIQFPLPQNASAAQMDAVKTKAQAVLERARKGEEFRSLAYENQSGEGPADGDLGFIQRQHVLPEIEAATRSLKPGEIAGLVLCAGAYRIFKLEEIRTPLKPFEKVKDEIMTTLYQEKVENTYRTWLQTLRSESHIENRL